METMMLWILALYGAVAIWLQVLNWMHDLRGNKAVHYTILTLNSQAQIEWIVRSIAQLSRFEGRSFYLYVLDEGSVDDTLAIVERLKKCGLDIHLLHSDVQMIHADTLLHDEENQRITIDLRERCFACEFKAT